MLNATFKALFTTTIRLRLRFDCDQGIDMSIFFAASNGVVANHSAVGGALSVTHDDVFIYSAVYYENNVKNCN